MSLQFITGNSGNGKTKYLFNTIVKEAKAHPRDNYLVIVLDCGTYTEESTDYPDYAAKVCQAINTGEAERGILVCGTGIGISIAANKIHGIRAALCGDVFSAQMSREHNNANVLCMGERVIGVGLAEMITDTWLQGEFAGGRYERRVDKIAALEAMR